jgi:hypothetical protein
MFIPVDEDAVQQQESADDLEGALAVTTRADPLTRSLEAECTSPPAASELSDWEQQFYSLDANLAAKVGFALGSVSASARQRVLISEFSRSAPCSTEDGLELHYGVALRLIVHVANFEAGANLTLPWVAAQAQVQKAETWSKLSVTGYVGDLGPLLPPIKAFTVDNYIDLMQKVSAIQAKVASDTGNIRPRKLRVVDPSAEGQEQKWAVGAVWALTQIADGRSCRRAHEEFPDREATTALGAIEDVYRSFGFGSCDDTTPSGEAQDLARKRLRGTKLKR